jgi:cytochrome P450
VRDDLGRNFAQANDQSTVLSEASGQIGDIKVMTEFVSYPDSYWRNRPRPPAPAPLERTPGPLNFLRIVWNGPIESLTRAHYELPILIAKTILGPVAYVSEPAALRHVLIENTSNYTRAPLQREIFAASLGGGLLTAEGRQWRLQRRLIGPMFTPKIVGGFAGAMADGARSLVESWGTHRDKTRIDIAAELPRATVHILERTLFHDGLGRDPDKLHRALIHVFDTAGRLDPLDALRAPRWLPRIGRLRARSSLALFARTADAVVATRCQRLASAPNSVPRDLLTVLLARQDAETGSGLSISEVKDNIVTFIAAGSETTASALTWALFLLSLDPEWRERIEAETDRELPDGHYVEGSLERLLVTRAVIEESMRLYPPVPLTTRQAIGPDRLLGQQIAPGTMVIVAPWLIHRHRLLWEQPDAFDPSRFLPGARERIARFSYLPFGAGPRACIGGSFVMQEMIIILATIVRSFRLDVVPNHRTWPVNHVTLRPRGGLPMILHRRN